MLIMRYKTFHHSPLSTVSLREDYSLVHKCVLANNSKISENPCIRCEMLRLHFECNVLKMNQNFHLGVVFYSLIQFTNKQEENSKQQTASTELDELKM